MILSNIVCVYLPSGKLTWLWKITIFNGKTHYKLPFSTAMLNYQRVYVYIYTIYTISDDLSDISDRFLVDFP